MSLISKETLLTHLQRAEMASDVRLPIEFFRDLVYQAMPRTWVGLTDEEIEMVYAVTVKTHKKTKMPPTQLMFARTIQEYLKSKNT